MRNTMERGLENISDQKGKTILITGSNSGIGFETAKALASKHATVIMACRNQNKGEYALDLIKNDHPDADISLHLLDVGSKGSICEFSMSILDKYKNLDVLINNAGLSTPPEGKTVDGFETQFGTNFLGPFILTSYLMPLLKATNNSRIVTLSSLAHRAAKLDFSNLNAEKFYAPYNAYGVSKLAGLFFAYELHRRLVNRGSTIRSVAAHPGVTKSNLGQGQNKHKINEFAMSLLGQPTQIGALPILMAAVDPKVEGGSYVGPGGFLKMRGFPTIQRSSNFSYEEEPAQKIWEIAEELTGVSFDL